MKRVTLFFAAAAILLGNIAASAQTHWTGEGGRGRNITIMIPQATGLPDSLNYIPVLVQGELVSNFSTFSAIEVFDRQAWEKQQEELMSEAYDESAEALINIGRQAPTQYFLTGNITRTASGYALQLSVIETAGNNTVIASHSGTSSFHELEDDLVGVRRASLDLLQKMGVTLTAQAQTELTRAATSNHISAQTALSRGIVAQRQGTEVAALSYFFQAEAFDSTLTEAIGRSLVMESNLSNMNLGDNVRNDIVWRRNWAARLQETEEAFYQMLASSSPPYRLHYSTGIETRDINYRTETADLSFSVNLISNNEWFRAMQDALLVVDEVLNGLNATGRKNDWQLGGWPQQGVTNTNPFARRWTHNVIVEFELVNEQGQVVGRQTTTLSPAFSIASRTVTAPRVTTRATDARARRAARAARERRFTIEFPENTSSTVVFRSVKADDISDQLAIRIASINGQPPETARLPIVAISEQERRRNLFLQIENGVVMGFARSLTAEQRAQHRNLVIPAEAFGNPVTAIANGAFENRETRRVTVAQGTGTTTVTRNTDGITNLVIPNTVTQIGSKAFARNNLRRVVIGANVAIAPDAFDTVVSGGGEGTPRGFAITYVKGGRRAGTYHYVDNYSSYGYVDWRFENEARTHERSDARSNTAGNVFWGLLIAVGVVGFIVMIASGAGDSE